MEKVKPESIGLSTLRLNRINTLISSYVNADKIAGAITVVSRCNQLAHFECHGKMDVEVNKSMREDAIFRIYSMTKPLTSVAMMMLYEAGHFQLTTPVSKFIPEFKNLKVFASGTLDHFKTTKPKREMTIVDLLTHTSGLTYDFMNASVVDAMYRAVGIRGSHTEGTLQDLIQNLATLPLLFSPGTRWNYSLATDVIGYLIEVISGESLQEFIKKNILLPLGMIDTDFFVPKDKQDRFTANYTHHDLIADDQKDKFSQYVTTQSKLDNNQKLILIDDPKSGRFSSPPTFYSGAGGLVSTAPDYLKFSQMLLNKGSLNGIPLLSPKTIHLMTSNHLPTDLANFSTPGFSEISPAGVGFGLGFAVMLDPAKANILGTPGEISWGGGANTLFFVDPKEALIGMLMMQLLPSTAYPIRREFRVAVYQAMTESYVG